MALAPCQTGPKNGDCARMNDNERRLAPGEHWVREVPDQGQPSRQRSRRLPLGPSGKPGYGSVRRHRGRQGSSGPARHWRAASRRANGSRRATDVIPSNGCQRTAPDVARASMMDGLLPAKNPHRQALPRIQPDRGALACRAYAPKVVAIRSIERTPAPRLAPAH